MTLTHRTHRLIPTFKLRLLRVRTRYPTAPAQLSHLRSTCTYNFVMASRVIRHPLYNNKHTILQQVPATHTLLKPPQDLKIYTHTLPPSKLLAGPPLATSERVFSSSGQILEKRSQWLNPDTVDNTLTVRIFEMCLMVFAYLIIEIK